MIYRIATVIIIAFVIAMLLMGIRHYFDQADIQKAEQILALAHSEKNTTETIWKTMAEDLHVLEKSLFCDAELVSRYEGKVLIECPSNERKYRWLVNINTKKVLPKNDLAEKIY